MLVSTENLIAQRILYTGLAKQILRVIEDRKKKEH